MFGAFITEGYLRHRPLRRKGPTTCKGRQRTMLQGIHFRNGLLAMLMAQTVVATDPPRRGGTAPDTVSAIVFYGDEKLLDPETAMSDEQIADLLDSLCTLDTAPEDMIRDLRLFQRIRSMECRKSRAISLPSRFAFSTSNLNSLVLVRIFPTILVIAFVSGFTCKSGKRESLLMARVVLILFK